MDDPFDNLSEQEIADACALADGTLPGERRPEVEAHVRTSPELTALVDRQRRALLAAATLAQEAVPVSLRRAVAAQASPPPRRRRRWTLALSAAGAAAAALVLFAVLSLGTGAAPSVASAADFALRPATGPAPSAVADTGRLDAAVGGVSFPDYASVYGWQATGVSSGTIEGRSLTVVSYERGGQSVGYAIVDGPPLPRPPSATSVQRAGVEYLTFGVDGRQAVTWESGGHTCVLTGSLPASELVTLASWSGNS